MRWLQLGPGLNLLVPPASCPGCGWGWPVTGPDRPHEGFMQCRCATAGSAHGHTLWTCVVCGSLVAEGCADVDRWGSATVPAGLPREARWAAPEIT